VRLADLSWPDVAERAAAGAILAVPVGATEQHGPHLPLTTDTDIALALCDRLSDKRPDVLVAPAAGGGAAAAAERRCPGGDADRRHGERRRGFAGPPGRGSPVPCGLLVRPGRKFPWHASPSRRLTIFGWSASFSEPGAMVREVQR
jgi:hypothetical protein